MPPGMEELLDNSLKNKYMFYSLRFRNVGQLMVKKNEFSKRGYGNYLYHF